MKKDYKKIDPNNLEDRVLLDPNGKILLSKSDTDYILTIELPDGNAEKHVFKAGFEYLIQYDRERNTSNARQLIGNLNHVITEFV